MFNIHVLVSCFSLAVFEIVIIHFEFLAQHYLSVVINLLERSTSWEMSSVVINCFFGTVFWVLLDDHGERKSMSFGIDLGH